MTHPRIGVVGGTGFLGAATVRAFVRNQRCDVVCIGRDQRRAPTAVPFACVDLTSPDADVQILRDIDLIIYAAGGSDHSLGDRDPHANLEANVTPFLRLLSCFRGSMVVLSSQAVYSGLRGVDIKEDVDHVPGMAYGLAKMVVERHAQWAYERGDLRSLWIHRLMYAFGTGEPGRRLIPRLVKAANDDASCIIHGGGQSFLNPLPADFVGEVLRRSALDLVDTRSSIITNVCHPEPWRVADVVDCVQATCDVAVELVAGGEPWPVHFAGSSTALAQHLARWHMTFPDVNASLTTYTKQLIEEQRK